MPNNSRYPMLNAIGLEIETTVLRRGNLPRNFRDYFSEDHDASIETPGVKINPDNTSQLLDDPDGILGFPTVTIGSELVSTVLSIDDPKLWPVINSLCEYLCRNNEPCENTRAGIHVHVSMGYTLNILKNFVKLAAHLEQVFYYVGGMGYEFRGVRNDFTYCRPVTKYGPSAIRAGDRYFQAFNTKELLSAKSVEEFFYLYGGIDLNNPPGKYYPIRYNWFTFYPLLTKGTVEFRVFNTTLNPQYIKAAVILSRKMCEVALNGDSKGIVNDLPENSIYDDHSKEHVLRTLLDFCNKYDVAEDIVGTLVAIIRRTPEINARRVFVLSHLDGRFNTNYQKTPKLLPSGVEVISPNFVDSHRLEREGRNNSGMPMLSMRDLRAQAEERANRRTPTFQAVPERNTLENTFWEIRMNDNAPAPAGIPVETEEMEEFFDDPDEENN